MTIRAARLCHHCAVPLGEDECLHYVYECHDCAIAGFELEAAFRRDPSHPDGDRLRNGAVEIEHLPAASRRAVHLPAAA